MENDQWEMQNDKAGGGMIRHWLQQRIKYPASSNPCIVWENRQSWYHALS
jgi:hypothetical protein